MLIYKTKAGQNIFDLSLQLYGNIQAIPQLLRENPILDINTEITPGTEIQHDNEQNEFLTFISNKGIEVSTGEAGTGGGGAFSEGFATSFNK